MKVSDLILIEFMNKGCDNVMPKYFRKEDIAYAISFQKDVVLKGGVIVTGVTEPEVVLTKEQAQGLESTLAVLTRAKIIQNHCCKWDKGILATIDTDTLCRAIYQGYTVEKTPEEELAELYNNDNMDEVRKRAIESTLRILKITVPGVNA